MKKWIKEILKDEPTKPQLEKIKLALEVRQMQIKFWKILTSIGAIVGFLAPTAAIVFAFYTGWFDLEKNNLENSKKILTIENYKLEYEQHILQLNVDSFNDQKRKIKDSIIFLTKQLGIMSDSLARTKASIDELSFAITNEKQKTKNLEIENIRSTLMYHSQYEYEKILSYLTLTKKYFKPSGVFVYVGEKFNTLISTMSDFNVNEIFPKTNFIDIEDVAKISKPTEIRHDSLFIEFEIQNLELLKYSSPVVVTISNGKDLSYTGFFTTRRISEECKCKSDFIAIDISNLAKGEYTLTYGLFHQGSLIRANIPLFFYKRVSLKIE
ncbi:MAG: hypothetical protein CVU11_10150 [Bacteroidetes bacterium HGW-Bacteroidetes-6]|jgi:hypothetical protein|nr:MAG: hypothetical protein CVU11_10150 [Bacteroidetes bacterium HGW-Bacteroidetes-6]